MSKRYYIPGQVTAPPELSADEVERLQRVILSSIRRAVEASAVGRPEIVVGGFELARDAAEHFSSSRYHSDRNTYTVPSYQQGGTRTEVSVIEFEEEVVTAIPDRVIENPPPFQGYTVLQLPGNHYVEVRSHRYATTADVARAWQWGRVLFGAEAWVIAVGPPEHGQDIYYVASLDEALTEADLRVQYTSTGIPGATGAFAGRVFPTLSPGYSVASLFFRGGGRTAPSVEAFVEYRELAEQSYQAGGALLDPGRVRHAVFEPIDKLLAQGDDEGLERAADLLAELNSTAFATLDTAARLNYIEALIRAWTLEPQEIAIIEILKSVGSVSELQSIFQQLRDAKLWEQLFNDLDSQLWSMLTTLGERFGDPSPLTLDSFVDILLEAKLISPLPGIVLGKNGPEISLDAIAEIQEAALSFVRFVAGFLEGLWMMVSHPEKIIEGIGQLVKMVVMFKLAELGYPPAQEYVAQALKEIGNQLLYGLKGAALTGMGPAILRRIKWAIVWEVASWFIGIGEVKAVLEGAGVTEKLAALARFLRALGKLGEVAESERVVSKLETLARILGRSSKILTREEEILNLLSRLPEKELGNLTRALGRAELAEGMDLAKLAEVNQELASAATESLRKSEALSQLASKAGGLSDEVVEAFGRLAGRFQGEQIAELLRLVPEGEGVRFVRAMRGIPQEAFRSGGAASADFLRALAENPKRMDALANAGYGTFAAIYERSQGNVGALDQYLEALADIERQMPPENKAVEFWRFLDQLERGDSAEWLELEQARLQRFEPQAMRLDPETVDRWIDEELARLGRPEPSGAEPVVPTTPPPALPPPAASFREALERVDLSGMTPAQEAELRAGWKKYQTKRVQYLKSEDEYIRFIYGKRTNQLPKVLRFPRELGVPGAVEQEAGRVLEQVVNRRLPGGSGNVRDIPTIHGNVRPDHLPPGSRTVYLKPDGSVATGAEGTPFSAKFVGDSKYRDLVPTTDQTRGFVRLAALSDEKKLVFYVRWKPAFPEAESLTRDLAGVGYELPRKYVPELVGAGVRELARNLGVGIVLVSDPLWL